jgi:hypothetical protein
VDGCAECEVGREGRLVAYGVLGVGEWEGWMCISVDYSRKVMVVREASIRHYGLLVSSMLFQCLMLPDGLREWIAIEAFGNRPAPFRCRFCQSKCDASGKEVWNLRIGDACTSIDTHCLALLRFL